MYTIKTKSNIPIRSNAYYFAGITQHKPSDQQVWFAHIQSVLLLLIEQMYIFLTYCFSFFFYAVVGAGAVSIKGAATKKMGTQISWSWWWKWVLCAFVCVDVCLMRLECVIVNSRLVAALLLKPWIKWRSLLFSINFVFFVWFVLSCCLVLSIAHIRTFFFIFVC